MIEGALELGVKYVSAYAFSTENWKRSPDEVRFLMNFNRDTIHRRRDEFHEMGVRVRWAGRRPRLWRSVINELEYAEELTKRQRPADVHHVRQLRRPGRDRRRRRPDRRRGAAGRIKPDRITEKTFARYLDEPDLPDVDLLVRTLRRDAHLATS